MASGAERKPAVTDGLSSRPVDADPGETSEWLESLDAVLSERGADRTHFLLSRLLEHGRRLGVAPAPRLTTDFVNTIPADQQPPYPGDEEMERRIRAAIRWNAAVMVSRANRKGVEVGGHIATYASAAHLYEVGLNHFFRGKDHPGGGDQVFFQGHASPGMYARAYLEGRLSVEQLDGFRQEASRDGLSSYPHPRLMPTFWEFPTVSMGITPVNAIYQARFNRYLHNRGIKDTSQQRVWAFLGDGEMNEVESLGALPVASREGLDNLTFVVNCNLQQLDGPVRGNGKIVQELEGVFRGAGWNVIKVIWGSDWDPLLARDTDGLLVQRMNTVPDGQFQTYAVESGEYFRRHFFGADPRLEALVASLTDDQLRGLTRGGHDHLKVYAAYRAAVEHAGQPTVILAHTVKGYLINALEARNATHQMKKLTAADVKAFRDRLELPVSDTQLDAEELPPYYHPGEGSEEIHYLLERRRKLGGFLPERRVRPRQLRLPPEASYAMLRGGAGQQRVATTMAFVRLLRELLKDSGIGARFVPIAPDEYRTFGMDSMFPTAKIYDPRGQTYESVDRRLLLSWKESAQGQMLHEGISEVGAMGSMTAAGTAYATHGEPMIPVYIFYSMFGFQRTGDFMWAFGDQMGRGFLLGATAGRTTLTGEGLQHADGHSQLLASTNPACVSYDPSFAFEVAHIVRDGLRRMYGSSQEHPTGEDVFYYITVYNEPILQPAEPADLDVAGLLRGAYRYARSELDDDRAPRVQLLSSGVTTPEALRAQQLLAREWGVAADVWSVTSWNELRREAVDCERHNLLHPDAEPRIPYLSTLLEDAPGPFVAVSDWMRSVPDQIARWVPGDYTSLGTDGWGFADTRPAARRTFAIDAESITVAALASLARRRDVKPETVREAALRYRIDDPKAVAHITQEGGDA